MLNPSELDAYFEHKNLSFQARQLIQAVRASDPSRRTKSGTKNVSCRYPSKKMGCTIQAESHTNELAALYEWDHDETTHEFYDQPPKIKLHYRKHEGKSVTVMHTPDYFILADGYTGWIECKTEEHLITLSKSQPERYCKDEHGNWRCPPGEAYAAELGLSYRLRSSAENDWILLRNLMFLSDYMDADCPAPTERQLQIAKSLFKEKPWMNLIDLVRADDALGADSVYKMIVDGNLHFPIYSQPLSEIEYAVIYRDQLSAEIYRLQVTKTSTPTNFDLYQPLELSHGEKLTWGGTPWRIDNVGKTSVFLSNAEGHAAQLTIEDMDTYIKEGEITGLPVNFSEDMEKQAYDRICEAGPEAMKIAVQRYQLLETGIVIDGFNPSASSIKLYRKKFREAEIQFGNGLIGLFPQISKRGNRSRKIDDEVIEIMKELINEKYLVPTKPQKSAVYGEVIIRCKEQGLVVPSEKTFHAEIKKISNFEIVLARSGKRAAYNHEIFYWRLSMEMPRHGERPFDIAHIDHTQVDIQLADRRYGTIHERPWLSIMMDAYSRKILAFWISFDEPSYRSCMMVIKHCIQQHGRIPRVLVVDGGTEFDGVYFETLIAHLKVTKKSRAKSKARFGSILERFFGINNTQFIYNLQGNTQATRTARQCTQSHDPCLHAAWTLETFTGAFANWVAQVYESNPHKSLGVSPAQAFNVGMLDFGMRAHKRISFSAGFELLCMPSTKKGDAKVDNCNGVLINYIQYWCPQLRDPSLQDIQVPVKYDPQDASRAFVYVGGHWVECQSELTAVFARRSTKQIMLISQEIKAKNRSMGRNGKITAEAIAHYIRSAEMTEKIQRQAWRDQEYEAAHPQETSPMADIEIEVTEIDDIELEVYGDF